jgi:hypothetical protein
VHRRPHAGFAPKFLTGAIRAPPPIRIDRSSRVPHGNGQTSYPDDSQINQLCDALN